MTLYVKKLNSFEKYREYSSFWPVTGAVAVDETVVIAKVQDRQRIDLAVRPYEKLTTDLWWPYRKRYRRANDRERENRRQRKFKMEESSSNRQTEGKGRQVRKVALHQLQQFSFSATMATWDWEYIIELPVLTKSRHHIISQSSLINDNKS